MNKIEKIIAFATLFSILIGVIYFIVDVKIYKEKVDKLEIIADENADLWLNQYEINGAVKEHMKDE